MKKMTILLLALSTALWIGGCGGNPGGDGNSEGTPRSEGGAGGEGGGGHGHAGEVETLGEMEIGAWKVKVGQAGEIEPDSVQAVFEIEVAGEEPAAVRAQIVAADGTASLKGKAIRMAEGDFDAHVTELPKTLAAGAKLVIELEGADGVTASGEFAIEVHQE